MKKIHNLKLGSSNDIIIYNPNSKFYFIPITKNASSFLFHCFSQIDWQYFKLYYHEQVKDKIPIIIYRDPIERWFSGFAQDYTHEKFPYGLYDKNIVEEYFKQGNFGIHTTQQHWFIHKFQTSNAVFIKFTKPYLNLVKILKDNINYADRIVMKPNHQSLKDYNIEKIIKQHYYDSPKNQKNLQNYLKEDIKFYETINFIDETKTLQNYKLWDSYKRTESI